MFEDIDPCQVCRNFQENNVNRLRRLESFFKLETIFLDEARVFFSRWSFGEILRF